MSDDDKQAVGDLASRGWRNFTRSQRAQQLRRELASDEISRESDPPMTEWWLEDGEKA